MSKLSELIEQRKAKATAAHELNDAYPQGKRMPMAQARRLDAMLDEVDELDRRIGAERVGLRLAATWSGR